MLDDGAEEKGKPVLFFCDGRAKNAWEIKKLQEAGLVAKHDGQNVRVSMANSAAENPLHFNQWIGHGKK